MYDSTNCLTHHNLSIQTVFLDIFSTQLHIHNAKYEIAQLDKYAGMTSFRACVKYVCGKLSTIFYYKQVKICTFDPYSSLDL